MLSNIDITTVSSAYATETCQRLYAEAFIAERRYRQQLMMAHAYKVRMLQAQDRARQASKDVTWFQKYASETRGGCEHNPDWQAHVIFDSARPFPRVPYNPDSCTFHHICQQMPFANNHADRVLGSYSATPITTP